MTIPISQFVLLLHFPLLHLLVPGYLYQLGSMVTNIADVLLYQCYNCRYWQAKHIHSATCMEQLIV